MKKILLLLMVMSMSACVVTGDKNSGSGDSGDGGTTDPNPDTNPTAKRFIANLRNLGSLYIREYQISIGDNGTISYICTATTPPTTYTYYLKEVKNDTQAIYSMTNFLISAGVEWKTVSHMGLSIEDGDIWGYSPINNKYMIDLFNIDKTDPNNSSDYEDTSKVAYDPKHISFDNPGARNFYKRDNSLTERNTLDLKSQYIVDYVSSDFTISGDTIIYTGYSTNDVTVTVSQDKNTITYTLPLRPPNEPRFTVLTFYKMNGSDAIYTTPSNPTTSAYFAITIKDNLLFMGWRTKIIVGPPQTQELDLNQRSIGYWLH